MKRTLIEKLEAINLKMHCNLLQVKGEYQAKEDNMIAYLEKTRKHPLEWYQEKKKNGKEISL